MLKKLFILLSAAAGLALLLFLPLVHAAIVLLNFIVHCAVLGLQLVSTRLPWVRPATRPLPEEEPFVCIQVPAHNEPPEVLMETLRSLSRIQWRNYEVLVIDNNTTDESLWRPVEAFCEALGPKFRFLHVENLPGFKAGAMNWARRFVDPRAEYLFVVDADYQVDRNCLRRAVKHATDSAVGLVQFPQHYRNITPENIGLALDFRHFFASYMNMANRLGCVPSTGTLALIRMKALDAIGGFSSGTITEDAELGFRMNSRGWRAVYVNENVGTGLMPYDLEGLKKQRWRWAFGNAQILKANWKRLLFGQDLTWKQKLGFVAHLTAWFNFNLIPMLSLLLLAGVAAFGEVTAVQHHTMILSGVTLLSFLAMKFGTMFYGLRRDGFNLRAILLAYFSHLGLGWIFSLSWIKCLWNDRSAFERTNKFIGDVVPGQIRAVFAEVVTGGLLLVASVVLLVAGFIVGPIAALALFAVRCSILLVWKQTVATCRWTERMLQAKRRESTPDEDDDTLAELA